MENISLGKYIASISRMQSILINDLLSDLSLSSATYLFLIKVNQHPGATQKELSEIIHIDRANTNRGLKKLEALNYIVTTPDPEDKRNKRSYPTPSGKEVYNETKKRLKTVSEYLRKGIPEDIYVQLDEVFSVMEENIYKCICDIKEREHDD